MSWSGLRVTLCILVSVCYLCVCGAGIATAESSVTACVLQTETGFMSLSHFPAQCIQEVIVTEGIHAMVVPREMGEEGDGAEG